MNGLGLCCVGAVCPLWLVQKSEISLIVISTIVSDVWVGDRSPSLQPDINRVLHPQRPSSAPVSAAAAGSQRQQGSRALEGSRSCQVTCEKTET